MSTTPILEHVNAALDGYHGMSLEMVLIGFEQWTEFVSTCESTEYDDFGSLLYRGVRIQRSVSPTGIRLLTSN
jgi:arabinogalactan endo-1,4-beta-galactosidase